MPTIRYEKQDNIGIITINRPEALNALNTAVFNELEPLVGGDRAGRHAGRADHHW